MDETVEFFPLKLTLAYGRRYRLLRRPVRGIEAKILFYFLSVSSRNIYIADVL